MKKISSIIILCTFITSPPFAGNSNILARNNSMQGENNLSESGDTVLIKKATSFERHSLTGKHLVSDSITWISGDTYIISQVLMDSNQDGSIFRYDNAANSPESLFGIKLPKEVFNTDAMFIKKLNPMPTNMNISHNVAEFSRNTVATIKFIDFTIVLDNIPEVLAFNDPYVCMNCLEYEWSIQIDMDNNSSTGDNDGFDVEVSLSHFKDGDRFAGSLLEGTTSYIWILNPDGGKVTNHLLDVDVSVPLNTITMKGDKTWWEFDDFDKSSLWRVHTFVWDPPVHVHYYSFPTYGPATVYDNIENDYDFLDIVEGSVKVYDITKLDRPAIIPEFSLSQNYPNPFNPSTTIEFTLPKSEFVELKIYNILGKEVSILVSKKLNQGNYTYTFDGSNLASGVYYYQLVAGDFRQVKKMILLR